MGFLDSLLKKSDKAPAEASVPKDARGLQELAQQKKAKGDVTGAVQTALASAKAHKAAGFNQKAVSVLKGAASWDPKNAEVFELLAAIYLEMKMKEDARGAFLTLKKLYHADRKGDEASRIDAQIAELGPGR